MEKRTTKEYKLNYENPFKTKYGTLNKNKPEVIYIKARGKIMPTTDKNSYSEEILSIKENLSDYVKNVVKKNDIMRDRYIFDIDTSDNGLKYKKKSHFRYNLYLLPKEIKPITEYENEIKVITGQITEHLQGLLTENQITYNF